jgi:hypothetical protein
MDTLPAASEPDVAETMNYDTANELLNLNSI